MNLLLIGGMGIFSSFGIKDTGIEWKISSGKYLEYIKQMIGGALPLHAVGTAPRIFYKKFTNYSYLKIHNLFKNHS